jgi:hypothetical protein
MSATIGAEKVRSNSAQIEAAGKLGEISDDQISIVSLNSAFTEFVEEFESKFINV